VKGDYVSKKNKEADPDLIGQVYEYDEDALAKVIGIQRACIQTARESIVENTGWTLQHGAVVYSLEGVERLLKALGVQTAAKTTEDLLKSCQVNAEWVKSRQGYRRARVSLIPTNRKIVLAMLMDHPERMTVRVVVGDNTLFVPSMEMSVRIVSEPDLYEMTGSRPRSRGKW
jgi:hypothetical protein